MLKSLYPQVDWTRVRIAGLDLDGTLYDEADFIAQVYRPVADLVAGATDGDAVKIHSWLLRRWLEKGSSYPHIFEESLVAAGATDSKVVGEVVARCVAVFRDFAPALQLPVRVQAILDALREKFPLFLITDGSLGLQSRKISSLGLQRWFDAGNVGISGRYGGDYCKPAVRILAKIQIVDSAAAMDHAVFFGDRDVDEQFAAAAGCQFVQVKCMHPVNSQHVRAT